MPYVFCRSIFWALKVNSYHLQKYVASYVFEQLENPRFFWGGSNLDFLDSLDSSSLLPFHCTAWSLSLILLRPYVFLLSPSYSSLCSYHAFLHSYIPVLPSYYTPSLQSITTLYHYYLSLYSTTILYYYTLSLYSITILYYYITLIQYHIILYTITIVL